MARSYDPSEGKVIIDGIDIRKVTLKSLRMQMGMVTQETILFNDSVRNNIAYGVPEAKEEKIIEAAKIAGAHEFIMNLPDKYSTTIGDRGVMLSGGERQRIAIARAMLKEPTILILDEATSSLDSESEYQVQKALDNLMKKHTVFIITHRLSSLQQANKIVVIDKGHIACFGTHSELLKNNEIYKRLYNLQFRE
jgi:subfamily B ATP-binding cassette protein MsbA